MSLFLAMFFKFIFSRTAFLYLVFFMMVWHIVDYPKIRKNAVDQAMNRLGPPVSYFKDFLVPHEHYDAFKLHQCIYYHKRVVDFYSFEKSEAYGMMGFCYDRLGDLESANKFYQAAVDVNPNYFWPYYNLGVNAYKKKDYSQAVNHFQRVLERNVKINLYLLYRSKVYTDVRLSDPDYADYNYLEGLRDGREAAYIFMLECLSKLGAYNQLFEVAILAIKEGIGDQDIFYYYAGLAMYYQKSYERALELLRIAVQKNSQNVDAYYYLGLCMRDSGKEILSQKFLDISKQLYLQQGSAIEKRLSSGVKFF